MREDLTLLADWLARTGFDVPPAYRLLLSDDRLIRARGQQRIAASRANALDTSLDEYTCLAVARDDLARLASPVTAEGLRAAERPRDPLFLERKRELKEGAEAIRLHLILAGIALTLALLSDQNLLLALLGAAAGLEVHLAIRAARRRSLVRRATRERRWSPTSYPSRPTRH